MPLDILLGIDSGTTRIKAVAVGLDGSLLGEAEAPTPWAHDGPCADVDPDLLADTAIAVAARTLADPRVPSDAIVRGIGTTGIAEAGVLLDVDGRPCARALAWYDPRGLSDPIKERVTKSEFMRHCGIRLNSKPSLAKVLYLRSTTPAAQDAVCHLGIADWIAHALGGDQAAELSVVSRTGMFDVVTREPWDVATSLVGDLLPDRIIWAGEPIGTVGEGAPDRLRGAALTVAGLDHEAASFAMGAMRTGLLTDSLGTAEALLRLFPAPVSRDMVEQLVERDVAVGWGIVPEHYCIVAGLLTGLSLERMSALMGITDREVRRQVSRAALNADRTGHPLRVEGSRPEGLTLTGVTEGLSPAIAWRAAVEDLTSLSTDLIDFIEQYLGPRTGAMVTGGWSHDPMVASAKRTQLGQYATSDIKEAAAVGAAYFGGIAAGLLERPAADEGPRWLA